MVMFSKNLLLSGIVIYSVLGGASAHAEPDVLNRPALQSLRANVSAMLGVARAGKRVVAVGERGIILLSDDNGETWRQANVPVTVSLTNVFFVSDGIGWAVGHSGVILRTDDGGASWTKQLDGTQAAHVMVEAASQKAEKFPKDPRVKRELSDAQRLVDDGPDKPFLDLWFRDEKVGFVVGAYGLLLGTTDGGNTWQSWQDRLDNSKGRHLYAIDVVGKDIYVAGEQGGLYHSVDDGGSFVEIKTPYEGTYFGVRHLPFGGVLAFGLRGNAFRTLDGGGSWTKIELDEQEALNGSIILRDKSIVLVNQRGGVMRSIDNGQTFQTTSVRQSLSLTGVVQVDDGSVVLVGLGGTSRIKSQDIEVGAVK
jgi:photosystem II stability/assembly factor-like uncharacterized protein